ncbi:MAG: hypothetical protein AAFP90_00500, partial [Planctomycetota bacterium]
MNNPTDQQSSLGVRRPGRWDEPFDARMSDSDVRWLMGQHPFDRMDPARFPRSTPLEGILRNDCRLRRHTPG